MVLLVPLYMGHLGYEVQLIGFILAITSAATLAARFAVPRLYRPERSRILLIVMLRKLGWAHTTRDAMIALFTGFIVVYVGLTTIGVAFRGESQELVPPTRVPNLEGDPSIQRYVPPPANEVVLIDTRTGALFHG